MYLLTLKTIFIMENNSTTQNLHCLIPTERSDEGSLTSVRDDKQKANMSYTDMLRETQQEEFPLLSEVTTPFMDNPLALMNAHTDDDGVVVPCALPDAMVQSLPQMMSETLSLYDDADIRTMLLMAMMPTIGSAMSHVRVRHGQRLYSLGMMNICVGPSASGKGSVAMWRASSMTSTTSSARRASRPWSTTASDTSATHAAIIN